MSGITEEGYNPSYMPLAEAGDNPYGLNWRGFTHFRDEPLERQAVVELANLNLGVLADNTALDRAIKGSYLPPTPEKKEDMLSYAHRVESFAPGLLLRAINVHPTVSPYKTVRKTGGTLVSWFEVGEVGVDATKVLEVATVREGDYRQNVADVLSSVVAQGLVDIIDQRLPVPDCRMRFAYNAGNNLQQSGGFLGGVGALAVINIFDNLLLGFTAGVSTSLALQSLGDRVATRAVVSVQRKRSGALPPFKVHGGPKKARENVLAALSLAPLVKPL